MRGIPGYFSIFVIIFLGIEILSFLGLLHSLKGSQKKLRIRFCAVYWIVSAYIFGSFCFFFLNPEKLRESTDYSYFSYVLVLTFFNIVPKAFLAMFTILQWLVSVFSKKTAQIIYSAGLILALAFMMTMAYSVSFGKKNIRIEKVPLCFDSLPKQLDGFTIMQLSDIHLGSMNGDKTIVNRMIEITKKLKPDLILFTGDMVNNFSYETDDYIDDLKKMNAPFGKMGISGNHDYGDYHHWKSANDREKNIVKIRQAVEKMGFDLLLNENRRIQVKDTAFYLIGVENWGHKPFPQYANLEQAMKGIPGNAFTILMSHDPAHWEAQVVPETSIPLTLSGHTHGLQFGIQVAGIEFSPMFFLQKHWGGLYKEKNQYLYVNRGIGTVGFTGRIEMRPEVTLFTLLRK